MKKETLQWVILVITIVGFVGLGIALAMQNARLSTQEQQIQKLQSQFIIEKSEPQPEGDANRCETDADCPSGPGYKYTCRFEEAFGGKVCLP